MSRVTRPRGGGRLSAATALLVATALVSACGPRQAFQVGVHGVAGDAAYGNFGQPTPAPPPPVTAAPNLFQGFPTVVGPPIPLPGAAPVAPVATAPACATASLLAPASEAPNHTDVAPGAGLYVYRQSGTWSNASGGTHGVFPSTSQRTVSASQSEMTAAGQADGNIDYTVTEPALDSQGDATRTVTSYQLQPYSYYASQPGHVITAMDGGIAITRIETDYTSGPMQGSADVFTPKPAIQVVNFPLQQGNSVETRASDVTTSAGTVLDITYTVTREERVDACGSPAMTWRVEFTGMSTQGSGSADCHNLSGYLDLATQVGGLIAADSITDAACGTVGQSYQSTSTATVNSLSPSAGPPGGGG